MCTCGEASSSPILVPWWSSFFCTDEPHVDSVCAVKKAMSVHERCLARRDLVFVSSLCETLEVMIAALYAPGSPLGERWRKSFATHGPSHLVRRNFSCPWRHCRFSPCTTSCYSKNSQYKQLPPGDWLSQACLRWY